MRQTRPSLSKQKNKSKKNQETPARSRFSQTSTFQLLQLLYTLCFFSCLEAEAQSYYRSLRLTKNAPPKLQIFVRLRNNALCEGLKKVVLQEISSERDLCSKKNMSLLAILVSSRLEWVIVNKPSSFCNAELKTHLTTVLPVWHKYSLLCSLSQIT